MADINEEGQMAASLDEGHLAAYYAHPPQATPAPEVKPDPEMVKELYANSSRVLDGLVVRGRMDEGNEVSAITCPDCWAKGLRSVCAARHRWQMDEVEDSVLANALGVMDQRLQAAGWLKLEEAPGQSVSLAAEGGAGHRVQASLVPGQRRLVVEVTAPHDQRTRDLLPASGGALSEEPQHHSDVRELSSRYGSTTSMTSSSGESAELRAQMDAFVRGEGDPQALVEAAQEAELLLPLLGEGAVWSGEIEDIRWLFAFTSTREMHAFLQQKWEAARPGELPAELARHARYLCVSGEELLHELLPALVGRDRVPMGVVVDVTSELRAFLPPVSGIVPDEIALDKQSVVNGEVAAS
ncbi:MULTISPECIES: SseB family protein [unclassified Streptomyces]|uniref:SseB family protein n=1 Tax=unclassified Streptomyces TaxID=2593676 RepID=UPI000880547A|nr:MULTISPECIES: SseB family protein [unclassified Streptomyces]PBC87051.1 hypothetical protein BX261_7188 [Streptomyces sp. 2321.6]SDQ63169.1 hypothetical protein SAMN05216511_0060 [Streptomyces sp. KS_16]SEE17811.1 hypothetical protein SAMN05428940_7215 [Streptomyces sp. 2133.1]SNC74228.1 hypothetical protein SAMN06272741_7114 [Streptomyces sp. 2114.4]